VEALSFSWIFLGGKCVDNYEVLGAVATKSFVVPSGKKWLVLSGYVERDASGTLAIGSYTDADKLMLQLMVAGAGTSNVSWAPSATGGNGSTVIPCIVILKAGQYIKYTWGVAQTTPEVTLNVLEVDAP